MAGSVAHRRAQVRALADGTRTALEIAQALGIAVEIARNDIARLRDDGIDARTRQMAGAGSPPNARRTAHRIVQRAGAYVILDAQDAQVGEAHPTCNAARLARRRIEATATRKTRPCITCGVTIVSTGAGHRMCNLCRTQPDVASPYSIASSR